MKKKYFLEIGILILMFVSLIGSCKDDNVDTINNIESTEVSKTRSASLITRRNSTKKLKERLKEKYAIQMVEINNVDNSMFGKLGCGYDILKKIAIGVPITESQENVTSPILDMDEILSSESQYINSDINNLNSLDYSVLCFANFQEDFKNQIYSFTDSVSFNLKAGSFKWLAEASASYKQGMTRSVNFKDSASENYVFAQSSLLIKTKKLALNMPPTKLLATDKYVTPNFTIIAHHSSPRELEKVYGQFLLTNYNLGGKIFANIGYESEANKDSNTLKEETGFMANVSFSGLFGRIGSEIDYQSKDAKENFRQKISQYVNSSMRLTATGGDVSTLPLPLMYTHGDISENNLPRIDFNPWLRTIKNNDVLISINKNGLLPLYEIIREKNISRNIKNYFLWGENIDPELQSIEYTMYKIDGIIYLVLSTRFGDNFIIDKWNVPTAGYEWWNMYHPIEHCRFPLSDDLKPIISLEVKLPQKNLIDLTPYLCSSDKEKVKVRFCKIANSRFREDMSYLLIENRETRKRIGLSLFDGQAFFDYCLREPYSFEEVNNVNYYDLYGL